jgi:hypothetical protein
VSGASGLTFASAISGTTVCSANVEVPVPREARRPVRQEAEPLLVADRDAAVRARIEAVKALAALGREERDDVVAWRDERDVRPDLLDHARTLVAEHTRRIAGRVGAGRGVEVGVAHAAGLEPDKRLAGPRLRELDLLDGKRLPELLQHRGSDPHRGDPIPGSRCQALDLSRSCRSS